MTITTYTRPKSEMIILYKRHLRMCKESLGKCKWYQFFKKRDYRHRLNYYTEQLEILN